MEMAPPRVALSDKITAVPIGTAVFSFIKFFSKWSKSFKTQTKL